MRHWRAKLKKHWAKKMRRSENLLLILTLIAISLCINCAKNTQNIADNKKTDVTTEDFLSC